MGKRLLKVLMIISFFILASGIYSMDEVGFIISLIPMITFLVTQYIIYGSINPLYLFQKKEL
jgi:hypothetical protein